MGEFDNAIVAGNAGDSWKPENAGDVIIGTYVAVKQNVGINQSNVYVVQEDGKDGTTSVWGSAVLDTKFEEIPVDSRVKIEFLGHEKGKGPKPYKNFSVKYVPPVQSKVNDIFPDAKEA